MNLQIQAPKKFAGKSSAASLQALDRIQLPSMEIPPKLKRGLYTIHSQGFLYDFIYSPTEEDRLFVLLSGYADRDKLEPPVFQRWSWEKYFPGHRLYIADPSLNLDKEIGLAWYVGTSASYILPSIAELIDNVAKSVGVAPHNVILYASSGGAFATLKLSPLLPKSTSVVINPQTDITRFDSRHVEIFLRVCFDSMKRDEAIRAFPERLSVMSDIEKLRNNKIVYAQNIVDTHHMKDHFQPFADALGLREENGYSQNMIETVFFTNEEGHAKGESPEIFPDLINRALRLASI